MIHRLDPRVKIVLTAAFACGIFLVGNFAGLALAAVLVAVPFIVSRVPGWVILKEMRPLLFIILITIIFQLFTSEGPWIALGPIHISRPGLISGVFIALRLLFLVVGAAILTLTTTPVELSHAIERLSSPLGKLGVPVQEIGMMIMIALRFIPVLIDETDKIIKAQTARGVRFNRGGLLARVRSVIPILIPLFVGIFRRSDELAEAMDARAFRSGVKRTRLKEFVLKSSDIAVLLFGLACIVAIALVGRLPA
jgi:energy-coupling factor transport system permease protein